jgi:photosystem II stability/assembly factor-like uncharacterized protein
MICSRLVFAGVCTLLTLSALGCSDSTSAADAAVDALVTDLAGDLESDAMAQPDLAADTTAQPDLGVDAPAPDSGGGVWTVPACTQITGGAGITFSDDGGKTLTPLVQPLTGIKYTFGLVTLARANTLVAQHDDQLWRSTDAGCSWGKLGKSPGLLRLEASGDTVYGWADNQSALVEIAGTKVTARTSPTPNLKGLGIDSTKARTLRVGGPSGQLWTSSDGGALWKKTGVAPSSPGLGYRVAFDPSDLDHAVYGRAVDGVFVTTDGGKSWTQASGLSAGAKPKANIFELAISPADGQIVWAMGIDLTLAKTTRQIFRSQDGGKSFSPVVAESGTVPMSNGTEVWPHPRRQEVVFFGHGSKFSGGILMTYDHSTGKVVGHKNSYHGVDSVAVSPADDDLVYIGLTMTNI